MAWRYENSSDGDEFSDGAARRTCWVPEVRNGFVLCMMKARVGGCGVVLRETGGKELGMRGGRDL